MFLTVTPTPEQITGFLAFAHSAGPAMVTLVVVTVCIVILHKFVFRDVLAAHVQVSENGKLAAASNAAAAAEHRQGSEATKGATEINKEMLEILKDAIAETRSK